jgi:hypothetical protein
LAATMAFWSAVPFSPAFLAASSLSPATAVTGARKRNFDSEEALLAA